MALGLAVGRLRLQPEQFWRMGLPEYRAILATLREDGGVPGRAEMNALMRRFPDRPQAGDPQESRMSDG